MLQKGSKAPDFNLKSTQNGNISLSSFKDKKHVILAFYPGDKTPVCTSQLSFYNELTGIFDDYDAQIIGLNNESLQSHQDFASDLKLDFPLLADESAQVLQDYEVFDAKSKSSLRALYVIDKNGTVQWSYQAPINVNPGADGILKALEDLQK